MDYKALVRGVQLYGIALVFGVVLLACGGRFQPAPSADVPDATPVNQPSQDPDAEPIIEFRTFRIVPEESEARYEVNEELTFLGIPLNRAVGRTSAIEGEFSFGLDGEGFLELAANQFRVDLSTLTSNDMRRDERIRERWLESDRFPLAEFVAQEIIDFPADAQEGTRWDFKMKGDMTVREVTRSLTYDIQVTLRGDTLEGTASTFLKMKDFGFDPPNIAGLLKVADGVDVIVEFTAKETGAQN